MGIVVILSTHPLSLSDHYLKRPSSTNFCLFHRTLKFLPPPNGEGYVFTNVGLFVCLSVRVTIDKKFTLDLIWALFRVKKDPKYSPCGSYATHF